MMRISTFFVACCLLQSLAQAKNLTTNEMRVQGAPEWLKAVKLEKISDRVQRRLEWKIRRVDVIWHSDQNRFEAAHRLGSMPSAVTITRNGVSSVHLGPQVNEKNYEFLLGHELVHVIFNQKHKEAIPDWLEEGFANYYSQKDKVNYAWLKKQRLPADVTKLGHPFKASSIPVLVQYKTSQALAEMLDKKCDLDQLMRLSVGRSLTEYIQRTCEIQDINKSFKEWLNQKK